MRILLSSLAIWLFAESSAQSACRQALALGLDVSGSIDLREYRLQLEGLGQALLDPDVSRLLLASPTTPATLMIYEWSGPTDQRVLLPWTKIDSFQTLDEISALLNSIKREEATPGTALGSAIEFGATALSRQADCWGLTLDISGDGKSNLGPHPKDVKPMAKSRDITVNALVIGETTTATQGKQTPEIGELVAYFRSYVISGPDSFVETALGFENYADAMIAKLKRELASLAISHYQ